MDNPALEQRASGGRSALEPDGNVLDVLHVFRGNAVSLCPIEYAIDLTGDGRLVGFTQARGRLDERLQNRCQIERRAADDLEHVGGGGLLLQRLAQLVEEPRVLDGDDRLRGEILNQFDLLVGEGANFLMKDCDSSNQVIILEHRHNNAGPNATKLDGVDDRWIALGIRLCRCNVGGLDRLLGSDQLAQGGTRGGTDRTASACLGKCPRHIVAGDDAQCPAFMEIEAAELGLANAYRVCQHRLKYRLKLARRA